MTDKELMKLLDQLVYTVNKIDDEAKRRYGDQGNLFFESEGSFYVMAGDCDGNLSERKKYVKLSSNGYARLGAGAW